MAYDHNLHCGSLVVQLDLQVVRPLQSDDLVLSFVPRRQLGVFIHWRHVVSQLSPLIDLIVAWLLCLVEMSLGSLGGDLNVLSSDVATVLESLKFLFLRLLPIELLLKVAENEGWLSRMNSKAQYVRCIEDSPVK